MDNDTTTIHEEQWINIKIIRDHRVAFDNLQNLVYIKGI